MAETGKRADPHGAWRHALIVLARSLTVPLLLAAGVLAFLLARGLYEFALAVSANFGQVFAFLALFGAITFFTKLGISQLNKHLVALLGDLGNYLRSIPSRGSGSFGASVRALARRLVPIFVLTAAAGLLSGYVRLPDAGPASPGAIPAAIKIQSTGEDVTLSFRGPGERESSTNIAGLRDLIADIVAQAREDRFGEPAPPAKTEGPVVNGPIRSNYVASFPILFERARLDSGARAAAADGGGPEFAGGASYDAEFNRDLIGLLVDSLAPCGEDDGTRPVWLSVRGYASSAPFRDGEGKVLAQSAKLNVVLANMRRRSVESALRAAIADANAQRRILLTPEIDYTLPSQLDRDRKFNDRPGASPAEPGSLPQDLLTRMAYINVLSAARCAPD